MITGSNKFVLSLSIVVLASLLTTSLQASRMYTKIVDDSFADGDFDATGQGGELDTPWWTSSSSSGKEISVGSLGLVTGTSGRGIHTIFPAQTLAIHEGVRATYTFTTPDSINVGTSSSFTSAFRVGLFDSLGQAGLNANVSASSSNPNPLYGQGIFVLDPNGDPGPGTVSLPGYMLDMDVYDDPNAPNASSSDLNYRKHNSPNTFNGTGRLMATTAQFSSVSPSGPDEGYFWEPNTTYTGSFEIIRINATEMRLVGTLGGATYVNTDVFDSNVISMLGFHVNSRRFGTSNSPDTPDNGIDFSNIMIETSIPEPSSIVLLMGAMITLAGRGRRR